MALADDVQRLLGIAEDYLAAGLEAHHLDGDDLADLPVVVPEVSDACLVLYDACHTQIQTAEDDSGLDVLDEG